MTVQLGDVVIMALNNTPVKDSTLGRVAEFRGDVVVGTVVYPKNREGEIFNWRITLLRVIDEIDYQPLLEGSSTSKK